MLTDDLFCTHVFFLFVFSNSLPLTFTSGDNALLHYRLNHFNLLHHQDLHFTYFDDRDLGEEGVVRPAVVTVLDAVVVLESNATLIPILCLSSCSR